MRTKRTCEEVFKSVILYDDCALAARANATLHQAMRFADESTEWDVKPWRMELLDSPRAAAEAHAEAVDAHLVLLAVRGPGPLPVRGWDWLEEWATHRQVPDAALAVFNAGGGAPLRLAQFARRHGLALVCPDRNLAGDDAQEILDGLHEREVAVTPTLSRILERTD